MSEVTMVTLEKGQLKYDPRTISSITLNEMTLTFPNVPDATGYTVYAKAALDYLEAYNKLLQQEHRLFNKRKKQARARTGRRR